MTIAAPGFAVIVGGDIQVNTVSETERAAKVNGLVTLFGMAVLDHHTDDEIAVAWAEIVRRFPGPVAVIPVEIAGLVR
jgi:hypothetical protein